MGNVAPSRQAPAVPMEVGVGGKRAPHVPPIKRIGRGTCKSSNFLTRGEAGPLRISRRAIAAYAQKSPPKTPLAGYRGRHTYVVAPDSGFRPPLAGMWSIKWGNRRDRIHHLPTMRSAADVATCMRDCRARYVPRACLSPGDT